jgi:hypothetical protein
VIYHSSGPSLEVIAHVQRFDNEREEVLQGVNRVLKKFTW